MRVAKKIAVLCAISGLSACSTFQKEAAAPLGEPMDAYSDPASIELQTKLARLQTENARLSNRVLELERENEALRSDAPATEQASADLDDEVYTSAVPAGPVLREPGDLRTAVVDNPEAPDMAEADVPVETSPRLTQPTFASTDAVFENEAEGIATPSAEGLFGVHLASYRGAGAARDGWRKLQRENPDELGLLEARLESVEIPSKGHFLRLIGGGFSSREKADALCASLKAKGLYCTVSEFLGSKLSLSETE